MNTGTALVDGKLYVNSTEETFSVVVPEAGSNYYRLILRKDFTAQTVRAIMLGPETAAYPTITQTPGTVWEITLARVRVYSAGTIAIYSSDKMFCSHGPGFKGVLGYNDLGGTFVNGGPSLIVVPDTLVYNTGDFYDASAPNYLKIKSAGFYRIGATVKISGSWSSADRFALLAISISPSSVPSRNETDKGSFPVYMSVYMDLYVATPATSAGISVSALLSTNNATDLTLDEGYIYIRKLK
jgi:hypothetical protein